MSEDRVFEFALPWRFMGQDFLEALRPPAVQERLVEACVESLSKEFSVSRGEVKVRLDGKFLHVAVTCKHAPECFCGAIEKGPR